jgi:hypothetical protein
LNFDSDGTKGCSEKGWRSIWSGETGTYIPNVEIVGLGSVANRRGREAGTKE